MKKRKAKLYFCAGCTSMEELTAAGTCLNCARPINPQPPAAPSLTAAPDAGHTQYNEMLVALKAIYECVPVTEKTGRALLLVHKAIAQTEGK